MGKTGLIPPGRWNTLHILILLLSAVTVTLFVSLGYEVQQGGTRDWDEQLLLALRTSPDTEIPQGPLWLQPAMLAITQLGSGVFLAIVAVAFVLLFARKKQYRAAGLLAVAALGGLLILLSLKAGFARPRPMIVPHLLSVTEFSFPSGHAMMSAVIYLSIASLLAHSIKSGCRKTAMIVMALLLSGVIGFSRVYLGVHYPSDVIAGWSVGLAWACLCWLVGWGIGMKREESANEHQSSV
jgi:undecaprenyl-diphosphatase